MTIDIEKRQIIKIQIKKIGIVLISMLVTFMIAMGPIAKVDGFNVLPWLDIPFHIWGGFLLGILGANILVILESLTPNISTFNISKNKYRLEYAYRYLLLIIIFVIFWGVIWEIWEYWMYITKRTNEWGGVFDTCKDIFDDMIGAVIAYLYTNKNK